MGKVKVDREETKMLRELLERYAALSTPQLYRGSDGVYRESRRLGARKVEVRQPDLGLKKA